MSGPTLGSTAAAWVVGGGGIGLPPDDENICAEFEKFF
jgi:hypothetical protein